MYFSENVLHGINRNVFVKGVHTALQHDVIVQSGSSKPNRLKVHYEAQKRTDIALQAIRKSRIDSWRW